MQTAYCMAVVRPHRLLQHLLILHEASPSQAMTRMQPRDRIWLVYGAWRRYGVLTPFARPSFSCKLASRAALSAAG